LGEVEVKGDVSKEAQVFHARGTFLANWGEEKKSGERVRLGFGSVRGALSKKKNTKNTLVKGEAKRAYQNNQQGKGRGHTHKSKGLTK